MYKQTFFVKQDDWALHLIVTTFLPQDILPHESRLTTLYLFILTAALTLTLTPTLALTLIPTLTLTLSLMWRRNVTRYEAVG